MSDIGDEPAVRKHSKKTRCTGNIKYTLRRLIERTLASNGARDGAPSKLWAEERSIGGEAPERENDLDRWLAPALSERKSED